MPRISVLINNYNYAQFIGQAIESVLEQQNADFEIIIVDDGSTDNSKEVIKSFSSPLLTAVYKENGGQLSAFNAAVSAAKGEICCFLDSDDFYSPGYLSQITEFFNFHPDCDFLFTSMEMFGMRSGILTSDFPAGKLGSLPFTAAVLHHWCGSPTSGISVRTVILRKFLPWHEGESMWRIRADDLLVWGADIVGACKYHAPELKVPYRIHGKNGFIGNQKSAAADAVRISAAETFCDHVIKSCGKSFAGLAAEELKLSVDLRSGKLIKAAVKLLIKRKISPRSFLSVIVKRIFSKSL